MLFLSAASIFFGHVSLLFGAMTSEFLMLSQLRRQIKSRPQFFTGDPEGLGSETCNELSDYKIHEDPSFVHLYPIVDALEHKATYSTNTIQLQLPKTPWLRFENKSY